MAPSGRRLRAAVLLVAAGAGAWAALDGVQHAAASSARGDRVLPACETRLHALWSDPECALWRGSKSHGSDGAGPGLALLPDQPPVAIPLHAEGRGAGGAPAVLAVTVLHGGDASDLVATLQRVVLERTGGEGARGVDDDGELAEAASPLKEGVAGAYAPTHLAPSREDPRVAYLPLPHGVTQASKLRLAAGGGAPLVVSVALDDAPAVAPLVGDAQAAKAAAGAGWGVDSPSFNAPDVLTDGQPLSGSLPFAYQWSYFGALGRGARR